MSQLTSWVSDLQCRVGGSGGGRLSGKLGRGWNNGTWICLDQGGPVGIVNSVGTLLPVAGGHGESRNCVLAKEPWDSPGGGDSDRMWSHI